MAWLDYGFIYYQFLLFGAHHKMVYHTGFQKYEYVLAGKDICRGIDCLHMYRQMAIYLS